MWQERAWAKHEDREMLFRVRASSAGRHWNGFDAIVYEASAGISEQQYVRHNVSMQLGRPLLVTSRCDGETLRRLQVPGDVKIVPPGIPRIWETESATVKLSMYLTSALVLSVADEMNLNPDRVAIAPQLHVRDPRIEHIGWAVKAELESPAPFDRVYGESLGVALASHLLRDYARERDGRFDAGLSRRRLRRVVDYIGENLAANLALNDLARVAGVSSSHFKTLFRQTVGQPVHQYIIRRRVDYATELLANERLPLAQIALQAGFANQSHMARCMKRLTGITPAQARALSP